MIQKKKSRITTRQIGGDDGYQWCVLIDGRVKWNGMTRQEAEWRAEKERHELGEKGNGAISKPIKPYGRNGY